MIPTVGFKHGEAFGKWIRWINGIGHHDPKRINGQDGAGLRRRTSNPVQHDTHTTYPRKRYIYEHALEEP